MARSRPVKLGRSRELDECLIPSSFPNHFKHHRLIHVQLLVILSLHQSKVLEHLEGPLVLGIPIQPSFHWTCINEHTNSNLLVLLFHNSSPRKTSVPSPSTSNPNIHKTQCLQTQESPRTQPPSSTPTQQQLP